MRIAVLLGSGASLGAGMPSVYEITARVLNGERMIRHSDPRFYAVEEIQAHHDTEPVGVTVRFLHVLKAICDAYYTVHEPGRKTN